MFLLLSLLSASLVTQANVKEMFNHLMQRRLENIDLSQQNLYFDNDRLVNAFAVKKLFHLNDYRSLWNDAASTDLFSIIEKIDQEGLNKQDYLFPIQAVGEDCTSLDSLPIPVRVECELALTESFLRIYDHIRFGKVDPVSLDPNWNYSKHFHLDNPYPLLIQSIKQGNLRASINKLRPVNPDYLKFQRALEQYKEIAEAGSWQWIPSGETIRPGGMDWRMSLIRKRLLATGDLKEESKQIPSFLKYSEDLQQAVKYFQQRHLLETDGVIGANTVAEMNVPVQDRINQIRVNLERLRWLSHATDNDFLLVDIPGFKAYLEKNGQRPWQGRIQVGKKYTQTPVFKGEIKYLVFNPTWTIPPGIIRRKILPRLRKNPAYLEKMGYILLDRNGNRVDSLSVDWKNLEGFPYIVREPAGKNNTLGRVKFIFPNLHMVYLHDTNNSHLFDRRIRTFSSGCIRIENPIRLAELLLKDKPDWNLTKIEDVIASGKTQRVYLSQTMPVLITYTTLDSGMQGEIIFKPDIYNRDPAVLQALDASIQVAIDKLEPPRRVASF